jgi:hypothetical protein
MKKVTFGIVFGAGLVVGLLVTHFPGFEAMAQNNWQCMTWNLEPGGNANPVSSFLSGARQFELESAGLSAGRFTVLACKL